MQHHHRRVAQRHHSDADHRHARDHATAADGLVHASFVVRTGARHHAQLL
jgi:hypothetical protein